MLGRVPSSVTVPNNPRRKRARAVLLGIGIPVVVAIVAAGVVTVLLQANGTASLVSSPATPTSSPVPTVVPSSEPTPTPTPSFNKTAQSIDDPNSIWVVVNKQRPIEDAADFVPSGLSELPAGIPNPNGHRLRQETVAALTSLSDAAAAELGSTLVAQSGYRSYDSQTAAYQYYVNNLGQAGADKTSARPGYSEHQTGLAIDILDTTSGCSVDGPCFGSSASGQWLAANAYRFGFILRYPADKTAVTGYEYEPWHFRYVGVELATEMHTTGVETLEEFFGLAAAPDY